MGAVRRQPGAAQYRARVHRPACRWRPNRGDPGARRRSRRNAFLRRHLTRVLPVRALPGCGGREGGRPRRRDARAVASVLRGHLRCHQARRHRRAALHAVRAGRHSSARAGLLAEALDHQHRKSVDGRRDSGRQGRRRQRRFHEGAGEPPRRFRADHARRRPRDLPIHVGHHARVAGGGEALPPLHRHADAGRTLRHRPSARRPFLLPFVARVGPRSVARHARPSRVGAYHRRVLGQVQRGAAAQGAARSQVHQSFRGRDALPDDAQLRHGLEATRIFSTSFPSPASRSTARPPPSPSGPSAIPSAACTAPPRSA